MVVRVICLPHNYTMYNVNVFADCNLLCFMKFHHFSILLLLYRL